MTENNEMIVGEHQVSIGDEQLLPRCSCPDFRHNIWPCKHLFRVITEGNTVYWNRLSPKFRASPYVNVDNEVLGICLTPFRPIVAF